jgi:hypothetical protein
MPSPCPRAGSAPSDTLTKRRTTPTLDEAIAAPLLADPLRDAVDGA